MAQSDCMKSKTFDVWASAVTSLHINELYGGEPVAAAAAKKPQNYGLDYNCGRGVPRETNTDAHSPHLR